ncbi:MAG TPA: 2,3-bisphosphoglycerate-independent phosphoglycerate mutase [Candidatus Fraserbacteria bacterium]|nr:2,3-bisphosphoglycerate-independent phosphoglycerate mutase [Candidatus Fraserbacteria bacterium]
MKALLVIADGLGGRPSDYQGQTCLEAARTPQLDELARRGITGLLDPIRPGVRPGSDTAHLSLFGYDPYRCYPGRGVFEAVGVGLEVQPGDVSFRTNFATVNEKFIVQDRRAGRIESGQDRLEAALGELKLPGFPEVSVQFKASTEHRGALVLRGPGLSAAVSEADPHETGRLVLEVRPTDETEAARRTADILNELIRESYQLLKDLPLNRARVQEGLPPANILLPRGAAGMPDLPQLPQLYGISGTVIAAGALYIGIGVLAGLEFKRAEGATGGLDSPILNKAKLAVAEFRRGADFIFLHVKGSDSAGHDHDAQAKIGFIEKIDEMLGYLAEQLDWQETHLAFTGDHCTPIGYGDHTAEPVPLLIVGPEVLPDQVTHIGERAVMSGGLDRVQGNVVPMLASYSNWLKKFGA